ncbi:MAG: hypothetical protein D4R45_03275 [Planctomycetaceae bacterium]|nr:MAG: hypothetical protein D4R45_03275 [Planctomycetaceae bacterium]
MSESPHIEDNNLRPAASHVSAPRSSAFQDPFLLRLEMAGKLAEDPLNDLTEISTGEATFFAAIRTLHNGGVLDLSMVLDFEDNLKRNRVSIDRKRVDEYIKALVGQVAGNVPPTNVGQPGTVEPEKNSLKDRLMFWR